MPPRQRPASAGGPRAAGLLGSRRRSVAVHRAPRAARPAGGCWRRTRSRPCCIALLTRPGLGRVGRTLREIYPLLLLVGLYGELDVLNSGGVRGPRRAGAALGAGAVRRAGEPRLVAGGAEPLLVDRAPRGVLLLLLHRVDPGVLLPLAGRPAPRSAASCSSVMTTFVRLLSRVHLLPGGRTVLRVPAARRWFLDNAAGAPGVRDARRGQLLRGGLPELARRGGRGRRAGRRAAAPAGSGSCCWFRRSCSRWAWSTARCTTGWTRSPGWWSGIWSRWRSGSCMAEP